jgi:hypothetical protein
MKDLLPIRNVRRRKVLLLAGLFVLGSSVSAAAPTGSAPSFAPVRSYATGAGPVSVALGDLNGDGKPDLATANFGAGTVSVLLNRGDGSFEANRDYPTGRTPELVEIADLNGDGKSDLVNLRPRSISVLLNQGAGTFAPAVSYAIGRLWYEVVIGDLNGDAKPDLVTEGGSDSIIVSVLLNHGDGTFEPKRDYLAGRPSGDIALGDVNGDGKPDLVIAHDDCCVLVLLNGGDGSFETRRDYEVPFPSRIALGDLNGDGKPDVATASHLGTSVLLNRGDGSFGAPRDYDCRPCNVAYPTALAIADLNGDGKADLVTEWDDVRYGELHEGNEYVTEVSVLLNKGNGTFGAAHDYESLHEAPPLAIVDLNGDGKPDIAMEPLSYVSVLLNKGDGSFEPSLHYGIGGDAYASAIGDLNGDGKPDIVAVRRRTVSVKLNTPGLCNVQWVDGMTVAAAKRTLGRVNCRVGRIRRAYSRVKRGRVISQRPRFGAVLRGGGKVNLVVSRGRKPS